MQKLRWITIVLFIVFGSLFHGFFYELETSVMLCLLSATIIIIMFNEKKIEIDVFQWLLLLFVANYWLMILIAQDQELALEEALRVTTLLLLSFLARGITLESKLKIFKICIWVGSCLVGWGIAFNLYRQNRYKAFWNKDALMKLGKIC